MRKDFRETRFPNNLVNVRNSPYKKMEVNIMNKGQLVDYVAAQTGLTKADSARAVDAVFDGIESVLDYSKGIDSLPKENVLKYIFTDGSWFAARPSGTEPKLKIYYSVCAENEAAAKDKLKGIREKLKSVVED